MNSTPQTVNLDVNETRNFFGPGKLVGFLSMDLPVQLAINGGPFRQVNAGQVIPYESGVDHVAIQNQNAVAVKVTFYIGDNAINYVPDSNSTAQAATYLLCNGGSNIMVALVKAMDTGGGTWSQNGNLAINVNTAGGLKIPGTNYGHRRKTVMLLNSTLGGNGGDVVVCDKYGRPKMRLRADDKEVSFDTSDDLYVFGIGGGIMKGAFFYSEIYYSN